MPEIWVQGLLLSLLGLLYVWHNCLNYAKTYLDDLSLLHPHPTSLRKGSSKDSDADNFIVTLMHTSEAEGIHVSLLPFKHLPHHGIRLYSGTEEMGVKCLAWKWQLVSH